MKIAFRNFLTTLRRYKISSLLNVIGLTLAFTAFYVIMTQVWWELGYNRSLHEADRIYLVENEDWYASPGNGRRGLTGRCPSVSSLRRRGGRSRGAACGAVSAPEPVGRATSLRSGIISFLLPAVRYRCLSSMFSLSVRSRAMCMTSENRRASSFPARRPNGCGSAWAASWVDTDEPQPDGAMEVVAVSKTFRTIRCWGECEVVKNLGETNLYTTSEWSFNYFVKFRPGADPDEFARQWTNVNQEMQREAAEKRVAAGDAADDDESGIYGVRLSPVSGTLFRVGFTGAPAGEGLSSRPIPCWVLPCWLSCWLSSTSSTSSSHWCRCASVPSIRSRSSALPPRRCASISCSRRSGSS